MVNKRENTLTELAKELEERLINLRNILNKYKVKSTREFLSKIEKGELPEHPTYEDYLEARSYDLEANEILKEIMSKLRDVERVVASA